MGRIWDTDSCPIPDWTNQPWLGSRHAGIPRVSPGSRPTLRLTMGRVVLHQESQTFPRHAQAVEWARRREVELSVPGAVDRADRKFKRPFVWGPSSWNWAFYWIGLAATALYPARATARNPAGRPPCHSIPGASRLLSPGTAFAWHRPQAGTHRSVRPSRWPAQSPSPSNLKQAGLRQRCPRAKRQFALVLIGGGLLPVREDLRDHLKAPRCWR